MPTLLPFGPFLLLLLLSSASSGPHSSPSSFVVSACSRARYPALCMRTLSRSSPRTPIDLARAAVAVSLSSVRSVSSSLRHLPVPPPLPGPLRDCFQQLSDSVDQLDRTATELKRLRPETFRWQLANACTWVSAALTNEDTCLDGMKVLPAGSTRDMVTANVSHVSRVTSNALYFVTRLASTRRRNR